VNAAAPWCVGAAGAFAVVAAWRDWDWFMEGRKARVWVQLLGRNGARVLYALIGAGLLVLAVHLGTSQRR
jgi:hypothetical protein